MGYPTDHRSLERDTDVAFLRASGPGGQHRNKVATGVRLCHRPSGITVAATERRSQAQNRAAAFGRLRERLEVLNHPPPPRVPTIVPARETARRLKEKRQRSRQKHLRRPPQPDEP